MREDKTYQLLVSKMNEVALIPPQSMGPFTGVYKKVVPFFKFSPWRSAAVIAFSTSIFLYFIFGPSLVRLASLLQFGF